jgi:uncharacterized membrane protein
MISVETWILWVHILAAATWLGGALTSLVAILPGEGDPRIVAARRAHFLTSRAMEVVVLTGLLNVLVKGMESHFALSVGFYAMLSLKMALLAVMAALQVWMGVNWKRAGGRGGAAGKARVALSVQCSLGAVAALLGLGLRAV